MGYLDSFADPLFKTDAEGRIVFFPNGKLGRGRIVPDAATAEGLRKTVKYGMPLLIVVAVAAVIGIGTLIGIGVAIVLGLLFQLYLRWRVSGLPVSDVSLTFGEVRQRQADALGMGWLIVLAIGSAILAASSLFMALTDGQQVWIGVFGAILFGVCLVMFLNMIRMRRRSRPAG
jgi:Flp pilus assembly protein TadB